MSSPVGACAPAGDPFLSADGLPGCPVPPPAVKPLPGCCLPVARSAAPSAPTAGLASPVARLARPAPPPSTRGPPAEDQDHPPTEPASVSWTRLASVPPPPPSLAASASRHLSSSPGWRALSGTKNTLPQVFLLVKGYFWKSQGYPRTNSVTHKTSSSIHIGHADHAQLVHSPLR